MVNRKRELLQFFEWFLVFWMLFFYSADISSAKEFAAMGCYMNYLDCVAKKDQQSGVYVSSFEYSVKNQDICYELYVNCLEYHHDDVEESSSDPNLYRKYILEPKVGTIFLEKFQVYLDEKEKENKTTFRKCQEDFKESAGVIYALKESKSIVTFSQAEQDPEILAELHVAQQNDSCSHRLEGLGKKLGIIQIELKAVRERMEKDFTLLRVQDSQNTDAIHQYVSFFLEKYSGDRMFVVDGGIYESPSLEYTWKKISVMKFNSVPTPAMKESNADKSPAIEEEESQKISSKRTSQYPSKKPIPPSEPQKRANIKGTTLQENLPPSDKKPVKSEERKKSDRYCDIGPDQGPYKINWDILEEDSDKWEVVTEVGFHPSLNSESTFHVEKIYRGEKKIDDWKILARKGDKLVDQAKEFNAYLGLKHAQWFLDHKELIPISLTSGRLIFPGTIRRVKHLNNARVIPTLTTALSGDGEEWCIVWELIDPYFELKNFHYFVSIDQQ